MSFLKTSAQTPIWQISICEEALLARVQVINETTLDTNPGPNDWTLWYQWCRYLYDDGGMDYGYRFIWRRPQSEGGSLQAARGQARLPSAMVQEKLHQKAKASGWGDYDADNIETAPHAMRG
jgi:hypothetical protein